MESLPPRTLILKLDHSKYKPLQKSRTKGSKETPMSATPKNKGTGTSGSISKKRKRPMQSSTDDEGEEETIKRRVPMLSSVTYPTGIDVGMSGSGMSCAPSETDPALVVAEMDWPGHDGKASKVPSLVALAEDNQGNDNFGGAQSSFFGFDIPKDAKCRSYFKATLDGQAPPALFDNLILQDPISKKLIKMQDPERNREAMAAALKHLHKEMLKKFKDGVGPDMLASLHFVHVFTFPAACSQKGQDTLRELAVEAGFAESEGSKIKLISEAHASAMATFVGCKKQYGSSAWKKFFKKNALVTIIDIGALTCDLTTVRIKSNDPRLNIEEEFTSIGGKCGTIAFHCTLYKKMAEKFGFAFTNLPDTDLERGSTFFQGCERIFRTFNGDEAARKHRLPLTLAVAIDHSDYDHETREVIISGKEIQDALDSNIAHMETLLQDQFDRQTATQKIETVVVCGGGSLITYVLDSLVDFCQPKIKAFRAKDPESTVCRGAVISQLNEDFLGVRRSRASFGIEAQEKGRSRIYWFITRGDKINTKKSSVHRSLGGHVEVSLGELDGIRNGSAKFQMPIYTFENDGDPPNTLDSTGVEQVATILISGKQMSQYFAKKLQNQMRQHGTARKFLEISIKLAVDDQGRMYFEAMTGDTGQASIGRGELRFDATEKSRDA